MNDTAYPAGKVLVTGGAGFIGSHTVDLLLKRGYQVKILDSLAEPTHHLKQKPAYIPKEAEFIQGDVRDKACVSRALEGVAYIFHFAAYQDYLTDFSKFFTVNSGGTALLYEVIVENNLPVGKVVVASSQSVMGEGAYRCNGCARNFFPDIRSDRALKRKKWEHTCPDCHRGLDWLQSSETVASPRNQYALSKYSQEMISLNLGRRYGIPTCALRYSIVQGPRQSFFNAYSGACRVFCLNLYFNRAPEIFEDGKQVRDYVNIEDVLQANLLALEDKRTDYQVFNIGGGRPYTIMDLAETAISEFSKDCAPDVTGKYRFGDTRHIFSDISKMKKLGWYPEHSPRKSLSDYRNWLYRQQDVENTLDLARKEMNAQKVIRSVI